MKFRWIYTSIFISSFVLYLLAYTSLETTIRNTRYATAKFRKNQTAIGMSKKAIVFQEGSLQNIADSAVENDKNNETDLIKDEIYWSDFSESFVPKGLSFNESLKFIRDVRGGIASSFRPGRRGMCGNLQNAIVGLEDGTVFCARYRQSSYSVYAEVLAFYLSRLLKMDNVPEVVLARSNSTSWLWSRVNTSILSWENNETVSLMRHIKNTSFAPPASRIIREAYLRGQTITSDTIRASNLTNPRDLADVIQWGTIIVFDSLVGQFDRLTKWKGYNIYSTTGTVHNILKSYEGKLWLIDNERSFFNPIKGIGFSISVMNKLSFHDRLLKTICVFQSTLIKAMQKLSTSRSSFESLWNFTRSNEPLLDKLSRDIIVMGQRFNARLQHILQWVQHCREMHSH